jgi:hypothetical protein
MLKGQEPQTGPFGTDKSLKPCHCGQLFKSIMSHLDMFSLILECK